MKCFALQKNTPRNENSNFKICKNVNLRSPYRTSWVSMLKKCTLKSLVVGVRSFKNVPENVHTCITLIKNMDVSILESINCKFETPELG